MEAPREDETLDELLRGQIRLYQPRRGARVSLDPLLLADFAGRAPVRRVVDLGCGSGVIALALARRGAEGLVGVEILPHMAALARRNAALNGVDMTIVEGDLRRPDLLEPESFDVAVANPPYAPKGRGRRPPAEDRALARQEIACTIDDVVAAARRLLAPRGRFAVVFPAERLGELTVVLARHGLPPRLVRPVHSVADEPARRVLVEGVREHRGGVTLLPPLVVHERDRRTFTEEAARILG